MNLSCCWLSRFISPFKSAWTALPWLTNFSLSAQLPCCNCSNRCISSQLTTFCRSTSPASMAFSLTSTSFSWTRYSTRPSSSRQCPLSISILLFDYTNPPTVIIKPEMNIFYFVSRWPRYNESGRSDKILSMIETLLNIGNMVHLVSADSSPESSTEHLAKMPISMVNVNPNKIMSSLASSAAKPELAIFNNTETEEMYSLHLYSKWNKCPRILELNRLEGLEQWRKNNYLPFNSSFIHEYEALSYPPEDAPITQKFSARELKSINRSDYYFCGNDFISSYLKKHNKTNNYIINSMGVPLGDFLGEIKDLQFREFKHRKHFAFLGNLNHQKNVDMITLLADSIWPLIRKEMPEVELHIIGAGYNKTLQSKKKDLEKKGIILKGYIEEIDEIQRYKATLFPIQYSTGTKGGIVESWFHHTPVVTTPIGAQGLFVETRQPKFSASQNGHTFSGFFKERVLTKQEQQQEKKLNAYYDSNKLSQDIQQFRFGGLCNSHSHQQFASNAIKLYNDEQLWNKSLLHGRKSILKNNGENQLEINLGFGLSQVQLAVYQTRKKKQYIDQWDRYLKSREGHNKLHERKAK